MFKLAGIIITVVFAVWLITLAAASQRMPTDDMVARNTRITTTSDKRSALRRRGNANRHRRQWKMLNALVANKVEEATVDLRQQIRELQRVVEILNSTTLKIQRVPQDEDRECPNGFRYQRKCFFTVLRNNRSVPFNEARAMCTEKEAELGDIVNYEHESRVQNLMRENLRDTFIQVWLGSTLHGLNVHHSDGSTMPSRYYNWYHNYIPSDDDGSRLLIETRKERWDKGLLNVLQNFQYTSGALCMKPIINS